MSYLSFTYPVTLTDPLSYLKEKNIYPKVFWQNSSHIRMGLGKILSSNSIPVFNNTEEACWFGSIPFMEHTTDQTDLWEGFVFPGFFLPQIYLQLNQNNYKGTISFHYLQETPPSQDEMNRYLQDTPYCLTQWDPIFLERQDNPSFDTWTYLVKEALQAFEHSSLKKVVLARATSLLFKESIHPFHILHHLKSHALNSTLFAYIPSSVSAFIGSSPEAFYTRTKQKLTTAAVAGTRKRGVQDDDDRALCLQLLQGSKEKEEFQYVVNFFDDVLSTLAERYDKTLDITTRQTTTVQHLYQQFQAYLPPSITDHTLIEHLHPTPAVVGSPKELSMKFLKEQEPFYRGLYASPLGWISKNQTDLIVAIRSSLIHNHRLTLFAGAGIITGSDPLSEWEELEHKISQFLKASSYAT